MKIFFCNSTYSLYPEHWIIQEPVYMLHLITCQGQIMPRLVELLLNYFPWNFVRHKKCIHSITWKPFKISSWNFIWISINIRWHANRENHNSCIYTFWAISLGISLVNLNVCWMYSTIWHQKSGRHLCFYRKTKSSCSLEVSRSNFFYYFILIYCILPMHSDKVNPDQTASEGSIWSGCILFVIQSACLTFTILWANSADDIVWFLHGRQLL